VEIWLQTHLRHMKNQLAGHKELSEALCALVMKMNLEETITIRKKDALRALVVSQPVSLNSYSLFRYHDALLNIDSDDAISPL
jgi:hypothetical protein